MTRLRQENVTAAKWSSTARRSAPSTSPRPRTTRSARTSSRPRRRRSGSRATPSRSCKSTLEHGEALDPALADEVAEAMKEWALERGATHYTHVFQPLTGPHRREARLLLRARRRRRRDRRVLRQGADPGRARRLLVPDRRRPRHLRGARLHRLGPDQPRLHPREPERGAALHPDRVRLLDRRGARRQDPAAALDGRALEVGDPGAAAARRRASRSGCSPPSAPSRSTS